ncbi:MAG: hypothetical protein ABF904_13455 [Ethanoligenens sp.]
METAAAGLLNLSVELGMQVVRQLLEPDTACISKSEVNRRFVKELSKLMEEFFNRRIAENHPIMMLNGMAVGKMTVIAVMGIGGDRRKRMRELITGDAGTYCICRSDGRLREPCIGSHYLVSK